MLAIGEVSVMPQPWMMLIPNRSSKVRMSDGGHAEPPTRIQGLQVKPLDATRTDLRAIGEPEPLEIADPLADEPGRQGGPDMNRAACRERSPR